MRGSDPTAASGDFVNYFFGGVQRHISQSELERYFAGFGEIVSLTIKKDAAGHSRGYGWVQFRGTPTGINRSEPHILKGVRLTVEEAHSRGKPENNNNNNNNNNNAAGGRPDRRGPHNNYNNIHHNNHNMNHDALSFGGGGSLLRRRRRSRSRSRSRSHSISSTSSSRSSSSLVSRRKKKNNNNNNNNNNNRRYPANAPRHERPSSDNARLPSMTVGNSRLPPLSAQSYSMNSSTQMSMAPPTYGVSLSNPNNNNNNNNNNNSNSSLGNRDANTLTSAASSITDTYLCIPFTLCPTEFLNDPRTFCAKLDQNRVGSLNIVPTPTIPTGVSSSNTASSTSFNSTTMSVPPPPPPVQSQGNLLSSGENRNSRSNAGPPPPGPPPMHSGIQRLPY